MLKYLILALVLCFQPQAATDLSLSSAVSSFQDPIGAAVKTSKPTEKQAEEEKGPLFNFKETPGFFKTIDHSHAAIKDIIARGIDYLNDLIAGLNITFLLLFILYNLSFFTVVYLSEKYAKANHRSPSFTLCATMVLLLLLVNTVFYGLAEEKIRDNELELSMKSFVFLYSFVAIGKIAISFIVGSTFHFFSPHPQTNTARKVYFAGLLHSFEKIIIFVLPVLVVALQAADFVQYCFHWAERCDNHIQKIILHMVRTLISGYGMLFYLSIYATYFPKFRKKVTSQPISTTLIIIILTLGFSEIFNTQGFWLKTFLINSLIFCLPILNWPVFSLISQFIKTPEGPTFIGADQILRRFLRIALVVTNVILGFRIIVIINTFGPDTLWFKQVSDNLYERFVTISFLTAAALLFYYKVLYVAKKISSSQEKRLEGNLYLVLPNSKFLAIINAVGDLGTIIFWPLYSYLVLIELGLNEVYLSSFYGIVVAGALLGGKNSIDDFFRGLSYILQGVIVRGGKILVNIKENERIFGVVEEIFLQNFYLRDRKGQLHILNYSVVKTITFHNEIYSSFVLQFSKPIDINDLNNLFTEEKNRFNKEQDDQIETISIFNISRNEEDKIEISYLIKGKPIKIWRAQALFEKRLGQILKKKKIQYTFVHSPSSS